MRPELNTILIVFTSLIFHGISAQNTVTSADLDLVLGQWQGSLTYLDYSTNQPSTMPANVIVKEGKSDFQVQLSVNYPQEPGANSRETIKISKDGSLLNKNKVVSRQELPGQEVKIITESRGKDNNKRALIKYIYHLGSESFIIRKEVRFEDSEEWLLRNEYSFTR